MDRAPNSMLEQAVEIAAGDSRIRGDLVLPAAPRGLVLFAHGSGSSRHSPRNRFVARVFNEVGLGTLLLDLLTPQEESIDLHTGTLRFDIDLLAARLSASIDDIARRPETSHLGIGLFGASTGAAAALMAAVARPERILAVVSRGGRPDLAGRALGFVEAPTLLIVGSLDAEVLELNRSALAQLKCAKSLELVPSATHLFEEPGALDAVSQFAVMWFDRYLQRGTTSRWS